MHIKCPHGNLAAELDHHNKDLLVIIVHGWMTDMNGYSSATVAEELKKRGVSNLRFDLSGFGKSDGELFSITISRFIKDLDAVVDWAREHRYENISLYGSSMGGTIVLGYAATHKGVNRIAALAPVSDFMTQRKRKYPERIKEWEREGKISFKQGDIGWSFMEDAENWVLYDHANSIQQPVLLVHGKADNAVAIEDTIKLANLLSNAKLIEPEGLGHRLKEVGDVTAIIADFLT